MSLGRMFGRQLSPITEHIFLTGAGGVSDHAMVLDAGITHVLNLAEELSHLRYPEHVQVKFVALRDMEEENLLPHLHELVDYIHAVVNGDESEKTQSSKCNKIVVHCVAGVSRSASTCIAYLMKYHQMNLKEAYSKVKEAREVISPNLGFWRALMDFELELRGHNSVELLPFVAGTVPSLDSYKKEMMMRIRLGWMDHVFFNMFFQTVMLMLQVISVCYFYSDYKQ